MVYARENAVPGLAGRLLGVVVIAAVVSAWAPRSYGGEQEFSHPKINSPRTTARQLRTAGDRSSAYGRIEPVDRDGAVCGDGTCDIADGEDFRSCADDCSSSDDRADLFAQELELAAFTVAEGIYRVFEASHCATLEFCWANNPTSPYGYFLIPTAEDEPDPDPEGRFPNESGMRSIFRLQPDEAIVYVGTTPPPSPYFSFTAYVFNRFDPDRTGDPPYDDRAETFASLGDSLNHLTLNTSTHSEDTPFNEETVVILTADRAVDASIRRSLANAGFPETMVNTLIIPRFTLGDRAPLARMGYENEDDVFTVLVRIANPDALEPESDIRAYLDDPGGRVFRVRPQQPRGLDPFPFPPLRPQGTGMAESGVALNWLVRRIENRYPDFCTRTIVTIPAPFEDGYFCLDNLMPCFADCRDTPYLAGAFKLGPPPEAIIVAGNNHEKTGKASYVNITVTRLGDATAFQSVVLRDLAGSADVFIPAYPGNDDVWQVKLSRDCQGEPFCYDVSEEQAPMDAWSNIIIRAYLEPATGTSPIALPLRSAEIVFPRIIRVNCPPR